MKIGWRIIMITLTAHVLGACSGDRELFCNSQATQDAIHLSTSLQSVGTKTRAADEQNSGNFVSGQYIDFFITKNDGVSTTTTKTTGTTGASGAISNLTTTVYWPVNGSAVNIYGWYPSRSTTDVLSTGAPTSTQSLFEYNDDLSGTGTFTIAADQSGYNASRINDLMVGVPQSTSVIRPSNNAAIPMSFTHLLSKVAVTIKPGDGLELSDLTGASVTIPGVYNQVLISKMNPAASQVSSIWKPADLTVTTQTSTTCDLKILTANNDSKLVESSVHTGYTGVAILPAQNLNTNTKVMSITLTAGGTINCALPHDLAAGSVYSYTITLNRNGISVSSTVNDWALDTSGGSNAFSRPKLPLEYVAVGNIKGSAAGTNGWAIDGENLTVNSATSYCWVYKWDFVESNFINPVLCSDGCYYHLPTTYEWRSVIPRDPLVKTDILGTIWSITEQNVVVDGSIIKDFESDFYSATECIVYGHRYKGTAYESAWRYEMKELGTTTGRLVIDAVYLGESSGIDIDNIKNESYWASQFGNVVSRVFPACGWCYPASSSSSTQPNQAAKGCGLYWSASSGSYISPTNGNQSVRDMIFRVSPLQIVSDYTGHAPTWGFESVRLFSGNMSPI